MMTFEISTSDDLLTFIKREDVSVKQGISVVKAFFSVIVLVELDKEQLIKETEYHIATYCNNNVKERPIFFGQMDIDVATQKIWNERE